MPRHIGTKILYQRRKFHHRQWTNQHPPCLYWSQPVPAHLRFGSPNSEHPFFATSALLLADSVWLSDPALLLLKTKKMRGLTLSQFQNTTSVTHTVIPFFFFSLFFFFCFFLLGLSRLHTTMSYCFHSVCYYVFFSQILYRYSIRFFINLQLSRLGMTVLKLFLQQLPGLRTASSSSGNCLLLKWIYKMATERRIVQDLPV